jgi:hypothetical protein
VGGAVTATPSNIGGDTPETACDLLLRRCGRWAAIEGLTLDPALAGAILDSRHFSSDGRLGYWTPVQVRCALLECRPQPS